MAGSAGSRKQRSDVKGSREVKAERGDNEEPHRDRLTFTDQNRRRSSGGVELRSLQALRPRQTRRRGSDCGGLA